MAGGYYYDRIEWWKSFESVPAPRVMVLKDIDDEPGFGAFVGEVHANIATAVNCVGCLTDGAVRDLPGVEALGFQLFAGRVSPSHAYAHLVEWGQPVDIGGLTINPGDLVHGDRHGVLTMPVSIVAELPRIARELIRQEREVLDLCQSSHFSMDALSAIFDRVRATRPGPGPFPTH
jgi:regulator of RNase E activity RraA